MFTVEKNMNLEYGKFHVVWLDSISDQVREVSKHETIDRVRNSPTGETLNDTYLQGSYDYGGKSFIGRKFNNWDEVFEALQEPWEEGLQLYDSMMTQLRDAVVERPVTLKRKSRWSEDDGSEVNVDRLLRGQAYWRDTYREHRPGPVNKTLITGISTACSERWENVLWRGCAAVCLTELLESAGYRIDLWATSPATRTYTDGSNSIINLCCKRSFDPLDVSSLITTLSGWAFRTIWFASYWLTGKTVARGYGVQCSCKHSIDSITEDKENTILCDGIFSFNDAVYWIKNQLKNLK